MSRFKTAAFSLQTSENNLKPPYTHLKRYIEVQQWMATRGSYVHKLLAKFLGASQKFLFSLFFLLLQISQNIDGFI